MPNEITQKLGFDASKAVTALSGFRQRLNETKQGLTNFANTANKFARKAAPAVSAMRELARSTKSVATALRAINTALSSTGASLAQGTSQMQRMSMSAQNLSGLYTRAIAGMGISTASMANQVATSGNKVASSATKTGSSMKKAGQTVTTAAAGAGKAATGMGSKMQAAGAKGAAAAKVITLNWKTVFRIIQAQLIIRAMSAIVRAFSEGARAAIDFRLAIAEVKTIAPPLLGDMDRISDRVRQLSADLGIAASEVAEGLYQTLSNQVVEAGKAFDFLRTAEELALITHAETRDAVNAMSSVMNSYSMTSEQATRVAGTLFKTVELGRLRLNEFADILGRVTPLTAQMGVEWEEAAAAMAVMTRQGVKVDTAITQLRAVMLKLVKPTEKMRDLFRQWGVRDAEQAIKKFGNLTGVLKELAKETGGNSQEMAEYFNRVRAVVGYMGIMTDNGRLMAETYDEIKEATRASKEEFEEYSKVPAYRIVKALNQIKLIFQELWEVAGPALAELLEWIVKVIPEARTLAAFFKDVVTILAALAKIIVLFASSFVEGWVKIREAITDAIESLREWFTLFPDMRSESEKTGETVRQMYERIDGEATRMNERFDKMREESAKRDEEFWKNNEQNVWNYLSEVTKIWSQLTDVIEAGIESVKTRTDAMWSSMIKKGKEAVGKLGDVQDDYTDYVTKSTKRLTDMKQRAHDQDYKLAVDNAEGTYKHRLMLEELDYRLAQARKAFAKAGIDEEKHLHALTMSQKAEEIALEAVAHAREMGNWGAKGQAQQGLERARAQGRRAEIAYQQKLRRANEEEMRQWQDNLERKISRIDELRKVWNDINEQLAKQEDQRGEESTRLRAKRAKVEAEIMRNLFGKKDMQIARMLGIEEGLKAFNTGVIETMQRAKFNWEVEVARLQAILNKTVFALKADFGDIGDELSNLAAEVLGRQRLPYEDVGQFLGKAWEKAQESLQQYRKDEIDLIELNTRLSKTTEEVKKNLDKVKMKPIVMTYTELVRLAKKHGISIKDAQKEWKTLGQEAIDTYNNMETAIDAVAEDLEKGKNINKEHLEALHGLVDAEREKGRLTLNNAKLLHESLNMIEGDMEAATEKGDLLEKLDSAPLEASKALTKALAGQSKDWAEEVEKGNTKQKETHKPIDTSKTKTDNLKTAAKGVTSELTTQEAKYKRFLELQNQGIQKERQYQETLRQRPDPTTAAKTGVQVGTEAGAEAAGTAETITTQPVEQMSQSLDLLMQKIDSTVLKIPTIGTAFDDVIPHLDEVVWRIMDAEVSTSDILQQVYKVRGGFDKIAEKIAECSNYCNNLITTIANVEVATKNTNTAMKNLGNTIANNTSLAYGLASAMRAAASAARSAAAACEAAAAACAEAEGGAYKGKLVKPRYRQYGGAAASYQARGRDRIPVMTSPGEFIINARSSRQFFSQLQAINAGRQPQYRDQGGIVNNIGDINVSIRQGETSQQTAREIAFALRRELRRGTSTLS
jgi:TP901 family phage tail tape measure protein